MFRQTLIEELDGVVQVIKLLISTANASVCFRN